MRKTMNLPERFELADKELTAATEALQEAEARRMAAVLALIDIYHDGFTVQMLGDDI